MLKTVLFLMKLSDPLYFVICNHDKKVALYFRKFAARGHKENHLYSGVRNIFVLVAAIVLITSCGKTRRLSEGQHLLVQNSIEITDETDPDKDELRDIIKQEPNQKFLGIFSLSLWAHNLPNPEVVEKNALEKRQKHNKKNEKREAEGKRPKRYKRTFGEWLQRGIGQPPVILDSILAFRSADQISLYLMKEGYFKNEVTHKIEYLKRKRARVEYTITSGRASHIRKITRQIPDQNILNLYEKEKESTLIEVGDRFSVSTMDRERERLLRVFKNNGYYDLSKDDIYFQVDSTVGDYKVDVILGVYARRVSDPLNRDSILEVDHIRYKINEITIDRTYTAFPTTASREAQANADTTEFQNYTIIGSPDLRIKPGIIAQNVRFEKDQYFSRDLLESTHRSLASLDIFSAVNIKFERVPTPGEKDGKLNSLILLTPAKKQQLILETRGTHNSGFFGTAGSVTYRNRNFLRGAEVFRFRISGAIEAQQLLTGSSTGNESSSNIPDQGTVFNTIEFVPEVSLTFPKFLFPIRLDKIAKSARPFTEISLSYGFQRRPDFTRNMTKAFMRYRWRESDFKTWIVTPVEVSLIKIFKSDEFQQRLDDLNDLFLNASYSDHLISAFKVSYIFNNQTLTRKRNTFYYRGNAETAGNTLNGVMGLTGAQRDSLGSYRVASIRYAHYVRTDHDVRYYRRFSQNSSLVFRLFGGIGVPLRNLEVLPFERSFFAGGANGIRAWQIQTLGPGSYSTVRTTFDRIGEAQIEGNVEYRQKIVSFFEGAIFADLGNVWLLEPDPLRPGGDFAIDRFMSEIALGAGLGLRLNFDFLIIRFDLALQMHDPALVIGERWVFQPKDDYNQRVDEYNSTDPNRRAGYYNPRLNFNLGIGYPF